MLIGMGAAARKRERLMERGGEYGGDSAHVKRGIRRGSFGGCGVP